MLIVFEVHVAPGSDAGTLLSEEVVRDTKAQVMTLEEAQKVGFQGVPDPGTHEVRLIAVAKPDARWVQRALESNEGVAGFKMHEV